MMVEAKVGHRPDKIMPPVHVETQVPCFTTQAESDGLAVTGAGVAGRGVAATQPGYTRVLVRHRSQSVPPYGAGQTLHVAPAHLLRHVHVQPVLSALDVTEVAWLPQWALTEHGAHTAPLLT